MSVSIMLAIAIAAAVVAAAGIVFVLLRRRPKKHLKNTEHFQQRWKDLQQLLSDKTKWTKAILDADRLPDEALKKKRYRGGSMGERLVKAQRIFTDNDGVWFGHKLRNKIDADPTTKLKKTEVQQALVGIRQA